MQTKVQQGGIELRKDKIRIKVINYLNSFRDDDKIKTKFNNLCAKTAQYNVPSELFQKRTSRKNRVLISWRDVYNNQLTLEQLNTFSGGVVVEFINNDFFDEIYYNEPLYIELKNRIGSDENVSSMISIRNESGSSSSKVQRIAFEQLIDNTELIYRNKKVIINKDNYSNYKIVRKADVSNPVNIGNEKIEGFIFIDIKGGQQDKIASHEGLEEKIFNPACEYASADVTEDVNLVMSYFALKSIDISAFSNKELKKHQEIIDMVSQVLKESEYESISYTGNLLEYCDKHISLLIDKDKLIDPIQFEPIEIDDFGIDAKGNPRCIDFTHDEAVNKHRYYFDLKKQTILSACRPTNIFWSNHISNMMQQNYTLQEYSDNEIKRSKLRESILNRNKM